MNITVPIICIFILGFVLGLQLGLNSSDNDDNDRKEVEDERDLY